MNVCSDLSFTTPWAMTSKGTRAGWQVHLDSGPMPQGEQFEWLKVLDILSFSCPLIFSNWNVYFIRWSFTGRYIVLILFWTDVSTIQTGKHILLTCLRSFKIKKFPCAKKSYFSSMAFQCISLQQILVVSGIERSLIMLYEIVLLVFVTIIHCLVNYMYGMLKLSLYRTIFVFQCVMKYWVFRVK